MYRITLTRNGLEVWRRRPAPKPTAAEVAGLRALALGIAVSCDNAMEGVGKSGSRSRPRASSHWPALAAVAAWVLAAGVLLGLLAMGARAGGAA